MAGRPAVKPSNLSKEELDGAWAVRALLTRPNWAVVKLVQEKGPITTKEIYKALGKQFTRKTLISSLKTLSLELRALVPKHVKGARGYEIGYELDPAITSLIKQVEKTQKTIGKKR